MITVRLRFSQGWLTPSVAAVLVRQVQTEWREPAQGIATCCSITAFCRALFLPDRRYAVRNAPVSLALRNSLCEWTPAVCGQRTVMFTEAWLDTLAGVTSGSSSGGSATAVTEIVRPSTCLDGALRRPHPRSARPVDQPRSTRGAFGQSCECLFDTAQSFVHSHARDGGLAGEYDWWLCVAGIYQK